MKMEKIYKYIGLTYNESILSGGNTMNFKMRELKLWKTNNEPII